MPSSLFVFWYPCLVPSGNGKEYALIRIKCLVTGVYLLVKTMLECLLGLNLVDGLELIETCYGLELIFVAGNEAI